MFKERLTDKPENEKLIQLREENLFSAFFFVIFYVITHIKEEKKITHHF
jgi:hypothetical protein